MNYDQAIADVQSGMYAWYSGWAPGTYIYLYEAQVYQSTATGPGHLYDPTPADKAATTWVASDHPPHP